jgi:hypothetical protein
MLQRARCVSDPYLHDRHTLSLTFDLRPLWDHHKSCIEPGEKQCQSWLKEDKETSCTPCTASDDQLSVYGRKQVVNHTFELDDIDGICKIRDLPYRGSDKTKASRSSPGRSEPSPF